MEDKSSVAEGSGIFESLFGGFSNGLSIFSNNPFRRKSDASGALEALAVNDNDLFSKAVDSLTGEDTEGIRSKSNSLGEKDAKVSLDLDEVLDVQHAGYGDFRIVEQTESYLDVSGRLDEGNATETNGRRAEGSHDVKGDRVKVDRENRKRKQSVAVDTNLNTGAGLHEVTSEFKKKLRKPFTNDAQESGIRHSDRNSKKRVPDELSEHEARKGRKLEMPSDSIQKSTEKGSQSRGKRSQSNSLGDENNKKRLKESDSGSSTPKKVKAEETVTEISLGVETRSGSKRKMGSEKEETRERKKQETVAKRKALNGNGEDSNGVVDLSERRTGKRKPGPKGDEKDEMAGKKKNMSLEDNDESGDRLSRTIFVGNLPLNVKTKHLTREFSKFGPVESARLRSVPLVDTKLPRRAAVITGQLNQSRTSLNGYVVFTNERSAKAALAHNMQLFDGKHLRVDMASAPRKAGNSSDAGIEYDRARSIFVGNLPFDVEDEEVYSIFDSESPDLKVEAVRVVRDPKTSIGKGFAFVCFRKKVGATNALDNAEHIRLKDRQLRIIRFGFKSKQSRANEFNKLSERASTSKFRLKPRSGAEERLSRKGIFSYQGIRSSKADGKPGKGTSQAQLYQKGAAGKKRGPSKSSKVENNQPAKKRPAVAARKLASGAGKIEKRRREGKGTKPGKERKKPRTVE